MFWILKSKETPPEDAKNKAWRQQLYYILPPPVLQADFDMFRSRF
jgi:hypothetical protein